MYTTVHYTEAKLISFHYQIYSLNTVYVSICPYEASSFVHKVWF